MPFINLLKVVHNLSGFTLDTSVKEHLGEDFTNSSIQFGSFLYFLKKKQYENAEKAIEEMAIPERQGTYSLLAREKSGIADWDYLDKNPKF